MISAVRIGREPVQKPGRSKQDYGTPIALIDAVEARWDALRWDLAATDANAKASEYYSPKDDALSPHTHWTFDIGREGIAWLNPPFGDIAPWARKCAAESAMGLRIIMLVPASIGSEWFAEHCEGRVAVIGLRPRLTFGGCKDPYPKDCCLLLWGPLREGLPLLSTWRWK
jgi:phage N-6-adenine-methyltransferase